MALLTFRKPEQAKIAADLGLTDQSILACSGEREVAEANRRLDDLKKNVRGAYRARCLELHPDRNPEGEAAMKDLTAAWGDIEPFLDKLQFIPRPPPPPRPVFDGVQIRVVSFPFQTMDGTGSVFGVTTTASGNFYWRF